MQPSLISGSRPVIPHSNLYFKETPLQIFLFLCVRNGNLDLHHSRGFRGKKERLLATQLKLTEHISDQFSGLSITKEKHHITMETENKSHVVRIK